MKSWDAVVSWDKWAVDAATRTGINRYVFGAYPQGLPGQFFPFRFVSSGREKECDEASPALPMSKWFSMRSATLDAHGWPQWRMSRWRHKCQEWSEWWFMLIHPMAADNSRPQDLTEAVHRPEHRRPPPEPGKNDPERARGGHRDRSGDRALPRWRRGGRLR